MYIIKNFRGGVIGMFQKQFYEYHENNGLFWFTHKISGKRTGFFDCKQYYMEDSEK